MRWRDSLVSAGRHPRTPPLLDAGDLVAGDVLLCYSQMMEGAHPEMDGYSHAAICVEAGRVLNADASGGVGLCSAVSLLESYDHLAVKRSSGLWNLAEVERLQAFAFESAGKRFNLIGMQRVPLRMQQHLETVMEKLGACFETGHAESPLADSYFCSQLVVAAFVYAGVIGKEASAVLSPKVATPLGLSADAVYGTFVGYVARQGYCFPPGDRFRANWNLESPW